MSVSGIAQSSHSPDRFAFDPEMANVELDKLLSYPPFSKIDHTKFPNGKQSILDVLRLDSRLRHFSAGDVVVRQGEYSNSAFIVLRGNVHIILQQLIIDGDSNESPRIGVWQRVVASMFGGASLGKAKPLRHQEHFRKSVQQDAVAIRPHQERPQLYLKDIESLLSAANGTLLTPGSLFGELAAMTRSPNDYTAIAREACTLLEVRWQGLRQLRRDRSFRQAIDDRYRESSLRTWLSQHPLLQYCPPEAIERIAANAVLQSYGEREWFVQYNQDKTSRSSEQIAAEPLICSEGDHADCMIIVRSGFARKSFQYGHSHRTVSYLSQGQVFGLEEICHNANLSIQDALPFQHSLRALGYLDVIRVDRETAVKTVLPYCRKDSLPSSIDKPRLDRFGSVTPEHLYQPIQNTQEESLLEFLVEHRLVNAREAMVINTDRCTRCDDCVRACATSHGGVSRFNRTGPTFGNFQFTQSCMHCVDPVCMIGCPTGAIQRDGNTGIVSINEPTCIGCKTCADACPYNNIVMEIIETRNSLLPVLSTKAEPQLVASKCDLCSGLPGGPACVNACPHEALERVDLSDTEKTRRWLNHQ